MSAPKSSNPRIRASSASTSDAPSPKEGPAAQADRHTPSNTSLPPAAANLPPPPAAIARPLWLAVHFPMFGLEVSAPPPDRAAPAAPTVLVDDARVVQMDALARQAGIRLGTTLATARSIAAKLRHFQRDPREERKRLEWLGLVAYRFSSRISLEPPDALHIEALGSLRLFGGVNALTRELNARYRQLGHATRIAANTTPLAALALARAGFGWTPKQPLGSSPSTLLRQVPIAQIGLPEREVERLANMGIRRLGELLDLPTPELGQRFSPMLVDYLHRLTGRKADPRRPLTPPKRFRANIHLLEGVSSKDALLPAMRRATTRIAGALAAQGLGTQLLAWRFKSLSGAAADAEVRLAQASADAQGLLRLSQLRLERTALPREVMSVLLRAKLVTPLLPLEESLLGSGGPAPLGNRRTPGDSAASAKLRAELVDVLTARLGDHAVRALQIVDDHRPEAAWTQTPAVFRIHRPGAIGRASKPHVRPLWLLAPPQPVDVRRFTPLGAPERIETGWWDAAQTRDYHIARAPSGARCWLYRDARGQWFLHGRFA